MKRKSTTTKIVVRALSGASKRASDVRNPIRHLKWSRDAHHIPCQPIPLESEYTNHFHDGCIITTVHTPLLPRLNQCLDSGLITNPNTPFPPTRPLPPRPPGVTSLPGTPVPMTSDIREHARLVTSAARDVGVTSRPGGVVYAATSGRASLV